MMAFIHVFEYARGVGSALSKEFFQCFIHFGEGRFMQGVSPQKCMTYQN